MSRRIFWMLRSEHVAPARSGDLDQVYTVEFLTKSPTLNCSELRALTLFNVSGGRFSHLLSDTVKQLHPPLSPGLIRATHARPLHPAALAYVPFGIVLY